MIEIKFSGDNWEELRSQIQGFAVAHLMAKFGDLELKNGQVSADPGWPQNTAATAPVAQGTPPAAPERKKPGRKPKAPANAEMKSPETPVAPTAPDPVAETLAASAEPETNKPEPTKLEKRTGHVAPEAPAFPAPERQKPILTSVLTEKHVIPFLEKLLKAKGRDKCVQTMNEFKHVVDGQVVPCNRLRDLDPNDYERFSQRITEILAQG